MTQVCGKCTAVWAIGTAAPCLEFSCDAGEAVAVRPISAVEFARLRREYLPPDGVIQEGASLSYLKCYAAFYAGGDFLLAAEHDGDSLTGMELLGNAAAAPGILGALGFSAATSVPRERRFPAPCSVPCGRVRTHPDILG